MNKNIYILPGDGIGPEVTEAAVNVLLAIGDKFGHQFSIEHGTIGAAAIDLFGEPLTDATIESCKASDAILLGAIGDPKYDNDPSATVRPEQGLLKLRKALGLFCNIRPVKAYSSLSHLSNFKPEVIEGVDLVIYRELTGGIYFGEKTKTESSASDLCIYHDYEIERICKLAFEEAKRRKQKLCLVDKANVLESSRLWRNVFQKLAIQHPEIKVDYMFIDNAAMQLILNPKQFDVVVTSNMFGDILSDEASVLSGSLGLLPSSSIGTGGKLYEPVHGSFPQATGKDIANPLATILSVEMMLRDFEMNSEADLLAECVHTCIEEQILTGELNKANPSKGSQVASFIIDMIKLGKNAALDKVKLATNTI